MMTMLMSDDAGGNVGVGYTTITKEKKIGEEENHVSRQTGSAAYPGKGLISRKGEA